MINSPWLKTSSGVSQEPEDWASDDPKQEKVIDIDKKAESTNDNGKLKQAGGAGVHQVKKAK